MIGWRIVNCFRGLKKERNVWPTTKRRRFLIRFFSLNILNTISVNFQSTVIVKGLPYCSHQNFLSPLPKKHHGSLLKPNQKCYVYLEDTIRYFMSFLFDFFCLTLHRWSGRCLLARCNFLLFHEKKAHYIGNVKVLQLDGSYGFVFNFIFLMCLSFCFKIETTHLTDYYRP